MDKHGEAVKFCPHFLLKSVLTSQQNRTPEHLKSFPRFYKTSKYQHVTLLKSFPVFETAAINSCPHSHGEQTGKVFKKFPRFLLYFCVSMCYVFKKFPRF